MRPGLFPGHVGARYAGVERFGGNEASDLAHVRGPPSRRFQISLIGGQEETQADHRD